MDFFSSFLQNSICLFNCLSAMGIITIPSDICSESNWLLTLYPVLFFLGMLCLISSTVVRGANRSPLCQISQYSSSLSPPPLPSFIWTFCILKVRSLVSHSFSFSPLCVWLCYSWITALWEKWIPAYRTFMEETYHTNSIFKLMLPKSFEQVMT